MAEKTQDPFILLLHKDSPQRIEIDGEEYYRTGIAVQQSTWDRFKDKCSNEMISPSEMLHHLMNTFIEE